MVACERDALLLETGLKQYINSIQEQRDFAPEKKIWKAMRYLNLELISSQKPWGRQIRFFTSGLRYSKETRMVYLIDGDSLDAGGLFNQIPNISAILDCGLTSYSVTHPQLPIGLQYQVIGGSSQTRVITRIDSLAGPNVGYYILMPESQFLKSAQADPGPTMMESDTVLVLLLFTMCLKQSNSDSSILNVFDNLSFIILPTATQLERCLEFLFIAGCLDAEGIPVQPMTRRVLDWYFHLKDFRLAILMAISDDDRFSCTLEAAAICSMLVICPNPFSVPWRSDNETQWIRLSKMAFAVKEGDLLSLLNVLEQAESHKDESSWFSR